MKLHSGFFLTVSRNKRAMKLNLKKPEGKEVFARLTRDADVVFESFRPGVVDRLGIGYDDVCKINPRIVYCSLSGYGQDGPYRDRAGHDVNYCSYAGVTEQTGEWDCAPALLNFQIADLAGGSLSSVMGILAALVDQQRTGKGRYVDVSMTDCTLAHAVITLARMGIDGTPRARGDDYLTGGIPSYGIYETADNRFVSLGALEPKFWNAFCAAIDRTDLADCGETWGDEGHAIRAQLETIFKSQPQDYWAKLGERVDCCLAPVLSLRESIDNEQIQARGMFVTDQHPTDGEVLQFAFPIKFSEFEFSIDRSAPLHGEHTEQVLTSLGYDDGEIKQMRGSGVI
jgi:crotonobetainyl-CoA:carnitine CoA-transferase CaiB-like acyl-CoA transferase